VSQRVLSEAMRRDLERYVAVLQERLGEGLVSVVVFGSRVRGEARAESDVDVLIVARGCPPSRFERYRGLRGLAGEVSEGFAETVAPILLTPEEAERVKPYYLGMLSGHEIVHDAGGFFAGVMARLRRRLAELGARRYVDADGYEYWDLKPDWKPGDVVTL
jgi:uncharacterized protein